MSLKNQLSFSSGELDPVLHDRVTLERFQNGLSTARNVMIGKTGSIPSRFSRLHLVTVDHSGPVQIYSPPGSGQLFEFGVRSTNNKFYYIVRDVNGTQLHAFEEPISGDAGITATTVNDLQFVASKSDIYIFGGSNSTINIHKIRYGGFFGTTLDVVFNSPTPAVGLVIGGTFTGYDVEYAFTYVKNGEESRPFFSSTAGLKKPILVGEETNATLSIATSGFDIADYSQVRVYRRPKEGSAFGFLGITSQIYDDAGTLKADFTDIGANADFANGIPSLVTKEGLSNKTVVTGHIVGTATIYQQRFIMANFINDDDEGIAAGRPGSLENFYRDFPYDADSALLFKAGSEGKAKVLRMIDDEGLVVFTTKGVFASTGLLSINNLALPKRGGWVIDESVPPLSVPGALLFVDKTTNSVRQLVFSRELQGYDSIDQSIFSSHLFEDRTIKSWAYQQGVVALIIVTFSDGTFSTFTYSSEHKMRAWTRHESTFPIEQVEGTGLSDITFFVTNKNGTRQIEKTIPRRITADTIVSNPEADKYSFGGFMDGMQENINLLNDSLSGTDKFVITPVVPLDFEGDLTLTGGTSNIFLTPGFGDVGTLFRVFNLIDRTVIDLTVKSRTDNNTVVVEPSEEFPSAQASDVRLYSTHTTITGLTHLEGEKVSVLSDGNVISSPNNDHVDDSSTTLTVTAGAITLPQPSAITLIGRPITADVKTLNISTVEQSPVTLESLTANKIYVRVHKSRGIYVSNQFPENKIGDVDGTSVLKMNDIDFYVSKGATPTIGNRYKQPSSKRVEVTIAGDWDSQGQISLRQVDPIHFEILSIIADLEVERRGRE